MGALFRFRGLRFASRSARAVASMLGLMFWFRWNMLVGSYLSFSATSRAYFSGP